MLRSLPFVMLAVAVAGCGAAPTPEQAVSGSSGKTAEAGTSRIEMTYAYEGEESGSISGAYDYERGAGILRSAVEPTRIVMRHARYEQMSEDMLWPDPERFGRERWLKSTPDLLADPTAIPFAGSPDDLLKFLRAAAGREEVGSGVERGEDVTRFRARVHLDRLLQEFGEGQREEVAEHFQTMWADSWREGVLVKLALDGDGRVRRVDFEVDDYMQASVELFDYGTEVAAKAPPGSDVMSEEELDELMKRRFAECERLAKQEGEEAAELYQRYCPQCHA